MQILKIGLIIALIAGQRCMVNVRCDMLISEEFMSDKRICSLCDSCIHLDECLYDACEIWCRDLEKGCVGC